jgi:hypothetical protein
MNGKTIALGGLLAILCPAVFLWAGEQGGAAKKEEAAMVFELKSSAFERGGSIPQKYAYRGEGQNVSPPLVWSGIPEGTVEFALICDDPDAPSPRKPGPEPWVHWVMYGIGAALKALPEGASKGAFGMQGKNSWDQVGYGGPMPPPGSGAHRYLFRLYALDKPIGLKAGAAKAEVLKAIQGHILGTAEYHGTYERR